MPRRKRLSQNAGIASIHLVDRFLQGEIVHRVTHPGPGITPLLILGEE
jgi:hypothetical protein